MSDKPRMVTALLARDHGRDAGAAEVLADMSEHERDYLVSCGLGPIAFQLLVLPDAPAQHEDTTLRSAHLTAWVIYKQMQSATMEILTFATAACIDVVLLKGISIADELYASPHHRIMGDIDLLVRPDDATKLAELLRLRGYRPREAGDGPRVATDHHHLPELRHPETGVSVEVHTSLVSRTVLADDELNQPKVFNGEIRASSYQGIPCQRFSPEYQIVYTLMHWAIDYKWPFNVISINDVIHLVNRKDVTPDWSRVAAWMREYSIFADTLTVLFLYLHEHGLIDLPPALEREIAVARKRLGRANLHIQHWLLTTFPMSGRRKVGWVMTRQNARVVWLTLLEPRHKWRRPLVALSRILFRRTKGKSLLGSVPGRIHTLLQPNG